MALLSDPAFYLVHIDGEPLETDIAEPDGTGRRTAFFLFSSMENLQEYAFLSQTNLRGYNVMSFETVEDVDQFVERHRDFYEYVVINPSLGQRTNIEPFRALLSMARRLAVEGDVTVLRDPAFYFRRGDNDLPLLTRLLEGVTMPLFSRMAAALEWLDAYELARHAYSVEGFYTLDAVRSFFANHEAEIQHITINPRPDPTVSPIIQPFRRLLDIAESAARPLPGPTEAPEPPDTRAEPDGRQAVIPCPVEIQESLGRFERDHPDPDKTAFIMMEFGNNWSHEAIAAAIKETLRRHDITGVRADDKRYHRHLYFNVQTYMHGCNIGVAVYDRIKSNAHNPNVALEVGYMFALRKPVCLLKDQTLEALNADLVGWLYDDFDTLNPSETIPPVLSDWVTNEGL